MKKKTLALLLILALCVSALTACGNSEQVSQSGSGNGDAASTDSGNGGTQNTGNSNGYADEEMAELNIALMSLSALDQNATRDVAEAVNEMTERDLNIHVNLSWYDAATYGTQVPIQIQAGEKLDIIMYTPVPGASYTSYRSANQLMDISGLLEQYGQTILAREGDLIKATSFGDAIYAIPNYRNLSGYETLFVRKDLADAAGVTNDILNAKTWTELHDAFMAITAETGMPAVVCTDAEGTVLFPKPYMNASENLAESYWFDILGDGYAMIMADEKTDTVLNYYATDEFRQMCERARLWYQDGLIYRDAANSQVYGTTLIKSDAGYAEITAAELGAIRNFESNTGYEPITVNFTDSWLGTSTCTKFGYAIPVTATEPEAAVRYLNYLYENADILNVLTWGVEGRDWVLNADGQAAYPEGVTADSVAYHGNDFLYGDQMMIVAWEGNDLDVREQQQHEMDIAKISKYMGFTLDIEGLENTITACKTVIDRYVPTLRSGSVSDWEASLDRLIADLDAAGMNDLLVSYQAQLDDWLAANH